MRLSLRLSAGNVPLVVGMSASMSAQKIGADLVAITDLKHNDLAARPRTGGLTSASVPRREAVFVHKKI